MNAAVIILAILCIILAAAVWIQHELILNLRSQLWDAQAWIDPVAAVNDDLILPWEEEYKCL